MEDRMANVEQSLARIEVRAAHLEKRIEEILENQRVNHLTLHKALHGTGDTPGLVVRVDRLDGWHKRQARAIGLLLTVTLPLLAARVWDMVTGQ